MPVQAGPPGHAYVTGTVARGLPKPTPVAAPAAAEAPDLGWMARAACRRADPELFFAPDGERMTARDNREAAAKAVCADCPVIAVCDALVRKFPKFCGVGVWGGMTEAEREAERARRSHHKAKLATAGVSQ